MARRSVQGRNGSTYGRGGNSRFGAGGEQIREERAVALREFREARDAMHHALAAALAQGTMPEAEVEEHQRILKRGARVHRVPLVEIRALTAAYRERTRQFGRPLPEGATPTVAASAPLEPAVSGGAPLARTVVGDVAASVAAPDDENAGSAAAEIQLEMLTEQQLSDFAEKFRLVCLMNGGLKAKEALHRLGLKRSERWVRNVYKRFEERGVLGLLDRRFYNGSAVRVFTPTVRDIVLSCWVGRPAAGPKGVWVMVQRLCQDQGVEAPSYEAVKKLIYAQPRALHLFRAGKMDFWQKQDRSVVEFQMARRANERWQADHSRLDIWIREWDGDAWVASEVWMTSAIDEFSRAIPGFVLSSETPTAWSISLLLMAAILPKERPGWEVCGIPEIFQTDRGGDFMANTTLLVLAQLQIRHDPDPPNYPNRKGKKERWYRSLDTGCLRLLPGHMDAIGRVQSSAQKHVHLLLTQEQLREEIERWIVEDYHTRTHSVTQRKPIELWQETAALHLPEDEEVFRLMLLRSDRTTRVQRIGVRFRVASGKRLTYWAPILAEYVQRQVLVSYNPMDERWVYLYCASSGELICKAGVMGRPDSHYTVTDVMKTRRAHGRGLRQRIEKYRRQTAEADAERARGDFTTARQVMEEIRQQSPEAVDPELDGLQALLLEMERQDRSAGKGSALDAEG
ncbi:MAG TPA: Mu transposase C-terminal domain-containing protein [Longimicrobiaceae bacterium]|nr:Mu transposase C-terminal domain-containing protein [Longimicrobiaceae bacterium]